MAEATNLLGGEEDFALREFEAVNGFCGSVGVVHDDQDGAYPSCGEEDGGVLLTVAGHDAYSVTDADSHLEESGCQQPAVVIEFVVRPPCPRPWDDDSFSGSVVKTLEVEKFSECEVDQRRVCCAVKKGESLRLRWENDVLPYWSLHTD